jgi:ankyrin repeat protein
MKYYHASSTLKIIDAAQSGDAAVVTALLSGDPDLISTSDERGYTAGHWASYSDDISVLDVAIAANEQVVWEVRTSKGQTCLHIACMCGSQRVVRRMLELSREGLIKYSLNGVNNDQETALHLAAAANHADLVGLLLGAGVDAALQDRWGRTAAEVSMLVVLPSGCVFASSWLYFLSPTLQIWSLRIAACVLHPMSKLL